MNVPAVRLHLGHAIDHLRYAAEALHQGDHSEAEHHLKEGLVDLRWAIKGFDAD